MARPSLSIRCPKSSLSWRVSPRQRRGRPGQSTATCPSCGFGLQLQETDGLLAPTGSLGGHWLGQVRQADPTQTSGL